MTWLITGGAGYIGSHIASAFVQQKLPTIVLDNLSSGLRKFVVEGAEFEQLDLLDRTGLAELFSRRKISGVVHAAGFKYAGVSVSKPLHTYRQNVEATVNLLEAMEQAGVQNLVFSSSASVYGTPNVELVTENTETNPQSPYGETKLIGEWLIRDQAKTTELRHTSLRYFNVVGSGTEGFYDTSPHNLFPMVFEALLAGETPTVRGVDYDTPDGSCVRDYIHVSDLAAAHLAAALKLEALEELAPVYNLGSGNGASVLEIMQVIAEVTGNPFTPQLADRRPGDPARIVASGELAAKDLGWKMNYSLAQMAQSAWQARLGAAS